MFFFSVDFSNIVCWMYLALGIPSFYRILHIFLSIHQWIISSPTVHAFESIWSESWRLFFANKFEAHFIHCCIDSFFRHQSEFIACDAITWFTPTYASITLFGEIRLHAMNTNFIVKKQSDLNFFIVEVFTIWYKVLTLWTFMKK